jgi:hypothetical protein
MSKHPAELTRKDMKAPDAFQTAAVKAATWVSGKQKFLVGGVVAVLVGIAVVIGGMSWSESRKVAARGSCSGPSTTPTARSPAFRSPV